MAVLPLLFLEVVEIFIQPLVALVPEAPVALGPLGDLLERRRVEGAGAPLRLAAARVQAGAFEHPQVLGNRRTAHRDRRRDLLDRVGARRATGEGRPACG